MYLSHSMINLELEVSLIPVHEMVELSVTSSFFAIIALTYCVECLKGKIQSNGNYSRKLNDQRSRLTLNNLVLL